MMMRLDRPSDRFARTGIRATPVIREQNWTVFGSPLPDTIYRRRDCDCLAEHETGGVRRQSQERGTDGGSSLCDDTMVCY